MILSYKLYISILLGPVKGDIKRTQTKTAQQHSNDKIQFTFFCLYETKSLGSANLNIFLRPVG